MNNSIPRCPQNNESGADRKNWKGQDDIQWLEAD